MAVNVSPVWIIRVVRENESESYSGAIDQQFTAFTYSHLGFAIPPRGPSKWWGITECRISEDPYQFISNAGIPLALEEAFPFNATADFRQNTLSVVVYSNSIPDDASDLNSFLQQIRGKISAQLTCYIYLIADVKSEDLSEKIYASLATIRNADASIIMDECNLDQNNPEGYLDIFKDSISAEKNKLNRAAQLILNLAVGHDKLYSLVQGNKKVFASGIFSLFFEKNVLKSRLASTHLTIPVLNNFFFASNREGWHDPHEETQSLDAFKKGVHANYLYQKLTFVFDSKFKDVSGFFNHVVSPWSLFSLRFLSDYFKGEIRTLLKRLVEFSRLLDARLMSMYDNHIREKKEQLQVELLTQIRSVLLSVWSENQEGRKNSIGIRQFINNLDEVQVVLKKAQDDLNSPDEFYKVYIHQLPLTPPALILDEYKKIKYSGSQSGISETESDAGKEEENLLSKIRNKLYTHPIPLGLFFRAAILGMVLSITIYAFIVAFLPDFLVNTSFFENGIGRYIWLVLIFIATVIISLLHYGYWILGKIRNYKKEYLAWVFHRIQQRLIEQARTNLLDILQTLSDECNRIKDNVNGQLNEIKQSDSPGISDTSLMNETDEINPEIIHVRESLYPESYFQQNVTEPVDLVSGLRYCEPIPTGNIKVTIPGTGDFVLADFDQEKSYAIMKSFLGIHENYKILFENLISEHPDLRQFAQTVQLFFEKQMILPVNHIGEFSLTEQAFKIIKSRSYPSAFNYVGLSGDQVTRFSFALGGIIPNMDENLKQLLQTSSDGSIMNLPLHASPEYQVDQTGYIQICNFYRLSVTENIRYSYSKHPEL